MMGMGEPLANFDNVVRAMSIMRRPRLRAGNKRVTLSTAGMVPMIDRLGESATCRWRSRCMRLFDALRSELVPLNKEVPDRRADGRLRALRAAQARHPVTFSHTPDEGRQTTSPEHARGLVSCASSTAACR